MGRQASILAAHLFALSDVDKEKLADICDNNCWCDVQKITGAMCVTRRKTC